MADSVNQKMAKGAVWMVLFKVFERFEIRGHNTYFARTYHKLSIVSPDLML